MMNSSLCNVFLRCLVVSIALFIASLGECYAWGNDCSIYFRQESTNNALREFGISISNSLSTETVSISKIELFHPIANSISTFGKQSHFYNEQELLSHPEIIHNSLLLGDIPTNETLSDTLTEAEFQYAGHLRYIMDGSAPLRYSKVQTVPMLLTGGLYAGAIWGLHVYQKQTLWNQRSETFKVAEDGDYALQVDKYGHFFGGYIMSYYASEILQSSGVSYEPARVWGTLMGIMYMGYIEAEDGFATGWSFSPSDFYMNVSGATFHLLQSYVPVLQNFTPKWIYMPSNLIGERRRLKDYLKGIEADNFNDDYSSSTFFLSMKMHNLLPQGLKEYWPKWLTLDIGYAARNLGWIDPKNYLEDRKYIVALDYDLVEMLPDFSKCVGGNLGNVLNWLKQSCNYFKFPSPAIEFGEHGMTRFNLLYPFKLSIGSVKF